MADFEPPKRIALSDSELSAQLEALRLEPNHLHLMQELLAEQAALRQQDEQTLDAWKAQLGELGGFDPSTVEIAVIKQELEKISSNQEAVSIRTDTLPIALKRQAPALRKYVYWFAGVSNWVVIAISISILTQMASLTPTEILISVPFGFLLSALLVIPMKSKSIHPLLQLVRPFGVTGRYWASGFLLAGTSLLFLVAIEMPLEALPGETLDSNQKGMLAAVAGVAILFALTLPTSWFEITLALAALGFAGIAFFNSTWSWSPIRLQIPSDLDWLSTGFGISAAIIILKVLGSTHLPSKRARLPEQLLLGGFLALGVSLSMAIPGGQWLLISSGLTFVVFLSLELSSRDSAPALWSRIFGLVAIAVAVVWITISPLVNLEPIAGVAAGGLAALFVIASFDLLGRRSAIHSASLESKHGFYGGHDWISLIAIVLSMVFGWLVFSDSVSFDLSGAMLLDATLAGLGVGLVAGLIRIHRVRSQENEILIVSGGNATLNNLLGL
ncbi:MAG: hypothetical protein K9G13_01240 [Aquiluna sp.]|nr:hypothetical protein [Aquiluna sp.]MCF8545155.1 hypothetical protein [Aquiluna sp.]